LKIDDATDWTTFVTLFTIEATLFDEGYFFVLGKLNSFNINCSCYKTRNYFLPISWNNLKSLFDLNPNSFDNLLQTSSTLSNSVTLIIFT